MPADQLTDVIYLEVAQDSAQNGLETLRALRTKLRETARLVHVQLLREIGQAHRFAIVQTWSGEAEPQAAIQESSAIALDFSSLPLLLAPADIRPHRPYAVRPSQQMSVSDLIVLTHVDVPPPCLPALEELYRPFMTASRAETGARCFDLLQSPTRPNHFTLVECWTSDTDMQAHSMAAHTLQFRRQLTPLLGALYDQRLYRLVP